MAKKSEYVREYFCLPAQANSSATRYALAITQVGKLLPEDGIVSWFLGILCTSSNVGMALF